MSRDSVDSERVQRLSSVAEIKRFRRALMAWYAKSARVLPWRGVTDPYRIWLSEIMLQQTQVAVVLGRYEDFLRRFPALVALALASEDEVLAAWSGLGYYKRARMLHRAAQFITGELGGVFPKKATELRTLPGIGEYTSAAIASIAFGESVAVVDGNVERVLLRLTGRPQEKKAASRSFVQLTAQSLVPPRALGTRPQQRDATAETKTPLHGRVMVENAAGDHNQAMMELGATVCLPRAPRCGECPVYGACHTRGEHVTVPKGKLYSREVAYLLALRKRGTVTQVLLAKRASDAGVMAGMYELPPLGLDATSTALAGRQPVLQLRHAITQTSYYVRVFAPKGPTDGVLRRGVSAPKEALKWVKTARLGDYPLTGLTRKALQRLDVMAVRPVLLPEEDEADAARVRGAMKEMRERIRGLPSEDGPEFDAAKDAEVTEDVI